MKRDMREWLRKLQLMLAVAMAMYPLHWLVAAWLGGAYVGVIWLFPAGAVLAGMLAMDIPGKLRPALGILLCAAILAAAVLLSPAELRWLWILQSLLTCVQILLSLPTAGKGTRSELPGYWLSFGVVSQVAGQVVLLTDWAAGHPGWMLRLSFFCYALLAMLSVNRQCLLDASGKRKSVPGSLKRRNLLMVLVLFGISLLGGLLPSAVAAVKDQLLKILRWAGEQIEKLFSRLQNGPSDPVQQSVSDLPQAVGGGGEMTALPPLLETVILYIGAAIAVALVGLLLYHIGKKLLRMIRDSWDLFGKFLTASSEDYVDEVTDTRETVTSERIAPVRRRRRRYKDDPSLSPTEQVRRRYQYLKHDHPDWMPGTTAREKLAHRAADIYEHARYSEHTVSQEDARAFIDMAKDI